MGNTEQTQLIELIREFNRTIQDMSKTLGSLTATLGHLSADVDKLPKMTELDAKIKVLESTVLLKSDQIIRTLSDIIAKLATLENSNGDTTLTASVIKDILNSEIERIKLDLQKTTITEGEKTKREEEKTKQEGFKFYIEKLGKWFPFILAIGAGIFGAIKFALPILLDFIGKTGHVIK